MRILRSVDHQVLPWKNGLGTSRIVASYPHAAGYDAVGWQIGTTGISASCPFSSLPGCDRQFMLLEGEGVELHCRGTDGAPDVRRRIDAPFESFAFRGDWQTECTLLGAPVRVFNVLTRRGRYSAGVSASTAGTPVTLEKAGDEILLGYIAAGSAEFDGGLGKLAIDDAMIADGPKPERYSLHGTPASVVIVRLDAVRPGAGQ